MRLLATAFSLLTLCRAQSIAADIAGVWVLDANKTQFSSPEAAGKLMLRIEPVRASEVSVTRISSDAAGQRVDQFHYVIALRFAVPQKAIERLILLNKTTAILEEWELSDGRLTIETPFTLDTEVHLERLVLRPAESWLYCPTGVEIRRGVAVQ